MNLVEFVNIILLEDIQAMSTLDGLSDPMATIETHERLADSSPGNKFGVTPSTLAIEPGNTPPSNATSTPTSDASSNTNGDAGENEKRGGFTMFPKLPVELRIMIWELAMPGRRFVEISDQGSRKWYPRCIEKAPTIFFTCQEARREVTRSYTPLKNSGVGEGAIWTDVTKDVLCIEVTNLQPGYITQIWDALPSKIRDNLTHLAIDAHLISRRHWLSITGDRFEKDISNFPSLEELWITETKYETRSKREIVGFEFTGEFYRSSNLMKYAKVTAKSALDAFKARNSTWIMPLLRTGRYEFQEW